MKTPPHTDHAGDLPNINFHEYRLQEFRGHPELVKFPSTSELFHALLENTFYASLISNSRGKTLEANETICKIFDYTSAEMTQLTTRELFDTRELKYLQYVSQLHHQGKAKAKITALRKNHERFSCEITSLVFIDECGKKRTINTIVDISKYYPVFLFE